MTHHGPLHSLVDVGIVEHDERGLPAQLHGGWAQVLGGCVGDRAAGGCRAGEGDLCDARVATVFLGTAAAAVLRKESWGVNGGGDARLALTSCADLLLSAVVACCRPVGGLGCCGCLLTYRGLLGNAHHHDAVMLQGLRHMLWIPTPSPQTSRLSGFTFQSVVS